MRVLPRTSWVGFSQADAHTANDAHAATTNDIVVSTLNPRTKQQEQRVLQADAVVLAMGGGSYPGTGSDGGWAEALGSMGQAFRVCGCVMGVVGMVVWCCGCMMGMAVCARARIA